MSRTNSSNDTQACTEWELAPRAKKRAMGAIKSVGQALLAVPILLFIFLYASVAQAECGGSLECIAVSIDAAVPPAHGTPLTSAPLAFGSQAISTSSASRAIFVGAVAGPAGMATLNSITLGGADAGQFALAGGTCVTGVPSLPHDGTTCTIDVIFTPTNEGAKNASVSISTSSITRTVPLSGFGDDGNLPDPTEDVNLKSVVRAQVDAAKRFSYTQIDNYQRRLQALRRAHQGGGSGDSQNATVSQFLVQLASSDSTDLGSLGAADASADGRDGYNWWGSGTVEWGTRDESGDNQNQRVRSDGISIGVDSWFSERLAAGLGIGLGNSDSDIGDNGAGTSADATSIAAYVSYQQSPDLYIDAVLGFGSLDFDVERYDVVGDAVAESSRDGSQSFASLSLTYDWSENGLNLWPYARIDLSNTTLDSATESGAGAFNLTYDEESYDSNRLSFGLLAEAPHVTNFGWVTPHVRLELQVEDEGNSDADVSYAGVTGGQIYTISPQEADDNKVLLGIGSDFNLRNGLHISAEYVGLFSSGDENNQSFNISLSSDFEGSRAPTFASLLRSGIPIQVEAGYRHDDNINRSAEDHDAQSEQVFNTVVSTTNSYKLSDNSRFRVRSSLGLEDAQEHQGLDNISVGVRGEWQYRGSGQFSTPTYGLFGRLGYDHFDSDLRTGARYAVGANLRKPFTDRLALFTALEHSVRDGDDKVFQNDHTGIRAMLNISTGDSGTVRFGGELREGDIVSSSAGSGNLSQISTAQVEDDAYFNEEFFTYRFDGKSTIWTLGYNHTLGPHDSLDFVLQAVDSEATDSDANNSETDYTSQRVSVFYLMSF
jgi:outer membrane autotransporter protein